LLIVHNLKENGPHRGERRGRREKFFCFLEKNPL